MSQPLVESFSKEQKKKCQTKNNQDAMKHTLVRLSYMPLPLANFIAHLHILCQPNQANVHRHNQSATATYRRGAATEHTKR